MVSRRKVVGVVCIVGVLIFAIFYLSGSILGFVHPNPVSYTKYTSSTILRDVYFEVSFLDGSGNDITSHVNAPWAASGAAIAVQSTTIGVDQTGTAKIMRSSPKAYYLVLKQMLLVNTTISTTCQNYYTEHSAIDGSNRTVYTSLTCWESGTNLVVMKSTVVDLTYRLFGRELSFALPINSDTSLSSDCLGTYTRWLTSWKVLSYCSNQITQGTEVSLISHFSVHAPIVSHTTHDTVLGRTLLLDKDVSATWNFSVPSCQDCAYSEYYLRMELSADGQVGLGIFTPKQYSDFSRTKIGEPYFYLKSDSIKNVNQQMPVGDFIILLENDNTTKVSATIMLTLETTVWQWMES